MHNSLIIRHVLFRTAVILAAHPESPHMFEHKGMYMREVLLQFGFAGPEGLPALFVFATSLYAAFANQAAASGALERLNGQIRTFQTREVLEVLVVLGQNRLRKGIPRLVVLGRRFY